MNQRFIREEQLIGPQGLEKLSRAHVAVFGAGGVGGYVIEALARSGIGALDIIDGDVVSLSNCNRQLLALESTLGMPKVQAAKARVEDINPACRVQAWELFFTPENAGELDFSQYDYVADAIDTVASKLELISRCRQAGVPVISCMGAGNKLDPTAFRVADIEKTSVCPLARAMRRELKKLGISGVKAVYSTEPPLAPCPSARVETKGAAQKPVPGSMAFVPAAAGLVLAAEIVGDLLGGFRSSNTP